MTEHFKEITSLAIPVISVFLLGIWNIYWFWKRPDDTDVELFYGGAYSAVLWFVTIPMFFVMCIVLFLKAAFCGWESVDKWIEK